VQEVQQFFLIMDLVIHQLAVKEAHPHFQLLLLQVVDLPAEIQGVLLTEVLVLELKAQVR
tara:strand:+ start:103 stop:282 length:180 start_codon:yes stop_codon:yes gene_type:complete